MEEHQNYSEVAKDPLANIMEIKSEPLFEDVKEEHDLNECLDTEEPCEQKPEKGKYLECTIKEEEAANTMYEPLGKTIYPLELFSISIPLPTPRWVRRKSSAWTTDRRLLTYKSGNSFGEISNPLSITRFTVQSVIRNVNDFGSTETLPGHGRNANCHQGVHTKYVVVAAVLEGEGGGII